MTHLADLVPEVRVKGSSSEDNLREASCRFDSAIESDAKTSVSNPVQCFVPPLVTRDPESGNRGS